VVGVNPSGDRAEAYHEAGHAVCRRAPIFRGVRSRPGFSPYRHADGGSWLFSLSRRTKEAAAQFRRWRWLPMRPIRSLPDPTPRVSGGWIPAVRWARGTDRPSRSFTDLR
jgi:hypothetical protein